MRRKDLGYDKMSNVAKVEMQECDLHHWLRYDGMENLKDHDAYRDRRKRRESIVDMGQRRTRFHVSLARKNGVNRGESRVDLPWMSKVWDS